MENKLLTKQAVVQTQLKRNWDEEVIYFCVGGDKRR